MSPDALNWTPLESETNSVYVLVHHMAGVESAMVQQVIGGREIHRDRNAEFAAQGTSVADLEALLNRVEQTSHEVLEHMTSADLAQMREPRPCAQPVSLHWSLAFTIGYMAMHLGHLQLTNQLYEGAARRVGRPLSPVTQSTRRVEVAGP